MLSRRKILIVTLFAIIGLMFLTAGFLVFRGYLALYRTGAELESKRAELDRLYGRDPFPSEMNVKVERSNLEVLNEEMSGLLEAMGRGQIESVNQSPPKFMAQFWDARTELKTRAKELGVGLAGGDEFDFGFSRHMQGNLPAPQDVPRLTQQLRIVQALCGVLYEARIAELKGIGREEFEVDAVGSAAAKPATPAPPPARRPAGGQVSLNVVEADAGLIPEGRQFGVWHFVIVFTAREAALINVLNGLAKNPVFTVVTRLGVVGDDKLFQRAVEAAARAEKRSGTEPTAKPAEPAKEATPVLPRDERVACGRSATPLTVRMELDVFQFVKVQPVGGAGKAEGAR